MLADPLEFLRGPRVIPVFLHLLVDFADVLEDLLPRGARDLVRVPPQLGLVALRFLLRLVRFGLLHLDPVGHLRNGSQPAPNRVHDPVLSQQLADNIRRYLRFSSSEKAQVAPDERIRRVLSNHAKLVLGYRELIFGPAVPVSRVLPN